MPERTTALPTLTPRIAKGMAAIERRDAAGRIETVATASLEFEGVISTLVTSPSASRAETATIWLPPTPRLKTLRSELSSNDPGGFKRQGPGKCSNRTDVPASAGVQ